MLQRFLLLWLILSSALALFWPDLAGASAFDPFTYVAPFLKYLIIITMFCIGWMLPIDEVRQVGKRWPTVILGTAVQFATMPVLAFLFGRLVGLEGGFLVGMVMVGCVPGAMASNVLTLAAGGNTSYSVSLTTLATLASPIAVPVMMKFLSGFMEGDAAELLGGDTDNSVFIDASINLFFWVVLPVVSGFLIGRNYPQFESRAKVIGSTVANLAILIIIAVVVGKSRDELSSITWYMILALLLTNIGGYCAGLIGGSAMKLPDSMKRALTLEVGMQNAGLGAVLAGALFVNNDAVQVAPALYTFGCMLTGTMLASFWSISGKSDTHSIDEADSDNGSLTQRNS
ncbi:MAG: bile acid:sodium symporter family protein [Pirellulaceae bacterium]